MMNFLKRFFGQKNPKNSREKQKTEKRVHRDERENEEQTNRVKCSICGRPLKKHAPDVFTAITGDSWLGTTCKSCGLVFCERCLDPGGSEPCPKCGNPISPAGIGNLPPARKPLIAIFIYTSGDPLSKHECDTILGDLPEVKYATSKGFRVRSASGQLPDPQNSRATQSFVVASVCVQDRDLLNEELKYRWLQEKLLIFVFKKE